MKFSEKDISIIRGFQDPKLPGAHLLGPLEILHVEDL